MYASQLNFVAFAMLTHYTILPYTLQEEKGELSKKKKDLQLVTNV